ncbi:hypothetical protein [Streptomyces sp. CLI2509]|uniref:hypothetical protein n=1 Tax=Streptomyces sp. CLI2509 TaxID=1984801 RepID=UPI0026B30D85
MREVRERPDEFPRGEAAAQQPGRRHEEQQGGYAAGEREREDAYRRPPREGPCGVRLAGGDARGVRGDEGASTGRREVAQAGGGVPGERRVLLVRAQEGTLPGRGRHEGEEEEHEPEDEGREQDEEQRRGERGESGECPGRREDEGPQRQHESGPAVPGDLALMGDARDGRGTGPLGQLSAQRGAEGPGDRAAHEPVAHRLHECGEPAEDAALRGPRREGGERRAPEPRESRPRVPGEEPGVERAGEGVPAREGLGGLDERPAREAEEVPAAFPQVGARGAADAGPRAPGAQHASPPWSAPAGRAAGPPVKTSR